jgi:serine/threonine-protein kinase
MATVYLAQDLKHHRPVAIKVLLPELAAYIGTERFLREIETAARLNHPHILALHDSGKADGLLYYVMPYVEGASLRGRLLREKQLSLSDAMEITRQVADALSYAHSHDVVHRDIKPENILFQAGHAVVSDFGIARAISTAGGDRLTGTKVRIGTPGYMSPEQSETDAPVDGRSDTYSLACVLYEMLAGEPPFLGNSAQTILARQLLEPVPPLRSVRATVPVGVERAILRALEKAPADRFATPIHFAAALVPHDEAEADGVDADSIAVLPFANMSTDPDTEYFSDGITEEIINALAQLPGLHVASRTSSFCFRGKAIDLVEVGTRLKVANVLEGSVRKAGSQLRVTAQLIKVADGYHLWSERYDREMTDVFAIQDEIGRAIADRLQVGRGTGSALVTPATANLDAYHLYLKGRYFWAQRGLGLKQAVECFSRALALDPNYALAHAGLADAYTLLTEYGMVPPTVTLPKVREAIQRALELAPDLAEAHCALGELKLVFDWEWPEAERELRRAIELNPRYIAAHYRLALFLCLVEGRFDEALMHARRAVELDPLAQLPVTQLAGVLIGAGRYEEALTPLKQATELGPPILLTYLHLGVVYNQLGRAEEAMAALEVAAAASGRHPSTLAALATSFRALGKSAEVVAIYEELKARARREYVQNATLASAASVAGHMDEAFQLLEQACEDRDSILIYCKRYPAFRLLQGDPRMTQIYHRIGFPDE